ncbi:hypothetical protein AVEN_36888-1, partial [Araneus ventricosus]
MGQSIEEVG